MLKNIIYEQISRYYDSIFAGLMMGMVFGDTSQMDPSMSHNLKITGMQHVVSASGFNVGLVSWLILGLLRPLRLPRKMKAAIAVGVVWWYVGLAGGSPPLQRAAIMASLSFGAMLLSRQYKVAWGLGLAVTAMIVSDPSLVQSVSLQLSVSATAGLIWVLPILQPVQRTLLAQWELAEAQSNIAGSSFGSKPVNSAITIILDHLREAFTLSLAAQALSQPLIWHYFGEMSWLSLVANTGLLWLTPLITFGSIFWMFVALFGPTWMVWLSSLLVKLPMWMFVSGLDFFGQFEWTFQTLPRSMTQAEMVLWWLAIASFVFIKRIHNRSMNAQT